MEYLPVEYCHIEVWSEEAAAMTCDVCGNQLDEPALKLKSGESVVDYYARIRAAEEEAETDEEENLDQEDWEENQPKSRSRTPTPER